MNKPVKNFMTEYLKSRFEGVQSACVVDLTGLDVQSTQTVRNEVRQVNGRMEVVKNTLARRAFIDTPLQLLGEALKGPNALVTGESIIDVAKKLAELAKKFDALTLKEAILEGDSEVLTVQALAKMKSRMEVLGDLAGLIWGPGRLLCGAIGSPQAKIAGCLKAIADDDSQPSDS